MILHELGLKYGTDKATFHNYLNIYDERFKCLKDEKIEFLEIGIDNGFSLKMWSDYFVNGIIYGADILDKSFLDNERIKTFIIDQANESELNKLPINLDIIIDDGGHTMNQQQITFKILFANNLKSKGYFVIEDLHTSLQPYFSGYGSNQFNNTLKLLNDLKSGIYNSDSQYYLSFSEWENLYYMIETIDIYQNGNDSITSIIQKK
jgi:demethylmacrocin O-methyltransferase